jgi:hypothetical protein
VRGRPLVSLAFVGLGAYLREKDGAISAAFCEWKGRIVVSQPRHVDCAVSKDA